MPKRKRPGPRPVNTASKEVYMPPSLAQIIADTARQLGISESELIRRAIRQFLADPRAA